MASEYRAVVGLGNPGSRYLCTRHNIGFLVTDLIRSASGASDDDEFNARLLSNVKSALRGELDQAGWSSRDERLEAPVTVGDWSASLIKPQAFMNRSGEPLRDFLAFKKIPIAEVVVVHDEIDLPLGSVRVKVDGGEGGHNGLRSISSVCGGRAYARVRVGVGKPPEGSPMSKAEDGVAAWVLSRFNSEELPFVEELMVRSAQAVVCLAREGLRTAQNRFNR